MHCAGFLKWNSIVVDQPSIIAICNGGLKKSSRCQMSTIFNFYKLHSIVFNKWITSSIAVHLIWNMNHESWNKRELMRCWILSKWKLLTDYCQQLDSTQKILRAFQLFIPKFSLWSSITFSALLPNSRRYSNIESFELSLICIEISSRGQLASPFSILN